MNLFIRWCFRIGLVCGIGFLLSAVLISLEDFDLGTSATVRSLAENVGVFFGLIFMLLGFVLLVDAIHSLRLRWSGLPPFGKFIGVIGLFATTFVGGYIYYYFFSRPGDSYRSGSIASAS
jgi:hypothetical protein